MKYLALDGLRVAPRHPTHFVIDEAVEIGRTIGAETTYLIHLSHDVDHEEVERTLPRGFALAYDRLVLEL